MRFTEHAGPKIDLEYDKYHQTQSQIELLSTPLMITMYKIKVDSKSITTRIFQVSYLVG